MEITVNVDSVNLTDVVDQYSEKTLGQTIAKGLVKRIADSDHYQGILGKVLDLRNEEIRAQLAPVITEALTKPVDRTNSYGEKTGQTTTLRELIAAEARRYLSERDNGYNAQKGTRLEIEVRKAVDAAFRDEIAAEVKQAKEAVVTQLGATVAELVATAVREALAKR